MLTGSKSLLGLHYMEIGRRADVDDVNLRVVDKIIEIRRRLLEAPT